MERSKIRRSSYEEVRQMYEQQRKIDAGEGVERLECLVQQ